jgi:predicted deacylase
MDNEYTLKLARAFGAPVILHSELRDGSLRAEGEESGIPILLYEAGEALRFDETCIRIGVKGIINVLRENAMLPKVLRKGSKAPITSRVSKWIKALGEIVKENEVIAYIDEPLDDNSFEILAPFDGIIIGKSQIPLVQEGDAVFHIAKFGNLNIAENKMEYFNEDAIKQSEFYELNNEEIIE